MIDTDEILYIILYKSPAGYTGTAFTPFGNLKVVMLPSKKRKNMWNLFIEVSRNPLEWIGTAFLNFNSQVPARYGDEIMRFLGTARIKGVEDYDFQVLMDKRGRIFIV